MSRKSSKEERKPSMEEKKLSREEKRSSREDKRSSREEKNSSIIEEKRSSIDGSKSSMEEKPSFKNKRSNSGSKTNSGSNISSESGQNVRVIRQSNAESRRASRRQRNMQRVEMLARPNTRRLRSLWDEKCEFLPRERRDKIKSALEEDYFLSPEQTEQYFQTLSKHWQSPGGMVSRKEQAEKTREVRQRQKWLINFSAQVAYRLCDYIAKGQKEMLVSNRLRSIADVVLEKVAEILGEPKPTRTDPGRLSRFMVAVSDRIAVWIENAAYRADALELTEAEMADDHMRLDAEKSLVY